MANETVTLARYAAGLRYADLPGEVVTKAKEVIADTVAACICGAELPWSRIVIDYAERTGPGGMVKRLHLGRASEAGVLAAHLAAAGFEAPHTVIEGEFGFLKVFCTAWDAEQLTHGLGREFATLSAVLKRYPVHATAHAPVKAVRDLQAAHGFAAAEIAAITVTATPRMVERHNIADPPDLMLAQYSIPFCVALALVREARDPESYDAGALADPQIRALCRKVRLLAEDGGGHAASGSRVTVALADGRRFERHEPSGLLEPGELPDKFARLTRRAVHGTGGMAGVYKRLMALDEEATLDWLG